MYVEDLTNTLTAPDRMHGHGHGGMNVTGDMQGMPGMGAAAPGEGAPEAESPEAAAGHSH
jgi:hypothetical protein